MCSKFFAMTDEKGLFHKKSQEIDVIHGELQLHVKSWNIVRFFFNTIAPWLREMLQYYSKMFGLPIDYAVQGVSLC